MKYEKPVIGRFQFGSNTKIIADATCMCNSRGKGEGYVVKHPHGDVGQFCTDWMPFTDTRWKQIPIEEEQDMNDVDKKIQALQQELDALKAAREAEKKPKLEKKKIDWSKVPVDTPIVAGEFKCCRHFAGSEEGFVLVFKNGETSHSSESNNKTFYTKAEIDFEHCKWQPWFGGECPVPEGVLVDVVVRHGKMDFSRKSETLLWKHWSNDLDIIAYRISGLEEGCCF